MSKFNVQKFYYKEGNVLKESVTKNEVTGDEFKTMFANEFKDREQSDLFYMVLTTGVTEMYINIKNLNVLFFTKKVNDKVGDDLTDVLDIYKFVRGYVDDSTICRKWGTIWTHEFVNCSYGVTEGNVTSEAGLRVAFTRDLLHKFNNERAIYCVMGVTTFVDHTRKQVTVFNHVENDLIRKYGLLLNADTRENSGYYGVQYAIDSREEKEFETQMVISTWVSDKVLDIAIKCFEQINTSVQLEDEYDERYFCKESIEWSVCN